MIKTIIFDYAGVITPTRDKAFFAEQNHKRFKLTFSELMDVLYKNWDDAAINRISPKEYWRLLSKDLNIDEVELRTSIINTFPIEPKIIELIDKLKGHYQLIMMSNQIEDWLESEIDKNNLRNKFDYFLNSYQVKINKPSKDIFLIALDTSKSRPEETLFIDDALKNVKAAEELGINGIVFDNFDQFYSELQKYISLTKF